jgi:hypothetical protein
VPLGEREKARGRGYERDVFLELFTPYIKHSEVCWAVAVEIWVGVFVILTSFPIVVFIIRLAPWIERFGASSVFRENLLCQAHVRVWGLMEAVVRDMGGC